MNSAHRVSAHAKRARLRAMSKAYSPIEIALRKARAEDEFRSQVITTRIKLFQAEEGEDATELLSCLAVVIGTPCEAGARQYGHTEPWVRQLHGALRTIQHMCLGGYTWQPQYAHALNRAIEIATEERNDLDNDTFTQAWAEANGLCNQIMAHTVTQESIAA